MLAGAGQPRDRAAAQVRGQVNPGRQPAAEPALTVQSLPPASSHPARSPSRICPQVPSTDQRRCRLQAVFQFPEPSGTSRRGQPARVRKKIPLITIR